MSAVVLQVNGAAVEHRQAGRGRDLVLLHSLLTEMSVFDGIVPALAQARRVTLINLPGYGKSAPLPSLTTVESYADHVAVLLEALALPRSTDVFGNGFGGFVAVALAARHGARFRRLFVADALAAFPAPAKEPLRGMAARVEAEGMAAVLDTAVARMFPPAFIAARPEVVAARKQALAGADAPSFARACRGLATLDLAPVLGAIRNPTFVTVGALDATTPPALAEQLAKGIRGAQFAPIADCGHCPMLEQPQALVSLIRQFLD
jgi:pimeloyl-ACP methyl ester carboxylesterase